MLTEMSVKLHTASVVVIANYHNPSILNADFLSINKITDEKWNVDEHINTPVMSLIKYNNGIDWIMERNKLEISESPEMSFQDYNDSKVYDLAKKYIKTVPHISYKKLGFNHIISLNLINPRTWINDQFLKQHLHGNDIDIMPNFITNVKDATLGINLATGTITHNDTTTDAVIINCNLHYEIQHKQTLYDKLSGWRADKKEIMIKINQLLEYSQ